MTGKSCLTLKCAGHTFLVNHTHKVHVKRHQNYDQSLGDIESQTGRPHADSRLIGGKSDIKILQYSVTSIKHGPQKSAGSHL